jgi:hypothetical protein
MGQSYWKLNHRDPCHHDLRDQIHIRKNGPFN